EKDQDWFDHGRSYLNDGRVCEQRILLSSNVTPKAAWALPGHVYSIFFEISELTEAAPVPDELKEVASAILAEKVVSDVSFVSRFPLVAVKATDSKEQRGSSQDTLP